jgi:serine/threonine protein kinase HipA of HipAB toxin-antitoxin module
MLPTAANLQLAEAARSVSPVLVLAQSLVSSGPRSFHHVGPTAWSPFRQRLTPEPIFSISKIETRVLAASSPVHSRLRHVRPITASA